MISLNKLFEEEKVRTPYKIYCDMDGVLCDFEGRFEHFTGLTPDAYREAVVKKYGKKQELKMFWNLIDVEIGVRFWRGMPWTPGGKELWEYIKKYKPTLLTAPSQHNSSKEGKLTWIEDHISGTPVVFRQAENKSELSGPNIILIDDREDTIMNWKAKNGIGILYKGTEQAINELKQIGL